MNQLELCASIRLAAVQYSTAVQYTNQLKSDPEGYSEVHTMGTGQAIPKIWRKL